MLAIDLLKEFKMECELRKLSEVKDSSYMLCTALGL